MEKDNFTDIVENLPQVPIPTIAPEPQPQQQVVNNDGETVTLGRE